MGLNEVHQGGRLEPAERPRDWLVPDDRVWFPTGKGKVVIADATRKTWRRAG